MHGKAHNDKERHDEVCIYLNPPEIAEILNEQWLVQPELGPHLRYALGCSALSQHRDRWITRNQMKEAEDQKGNPKENRNHREQPPGGVLKHMTFSTCPS
jgi:hypothetical protein